MGTGLGVIPLDVMRVPSARTSGSAQRGHGPWPRAGSCAAAAAAAGAGTACPGRDGLHGTGTRRGGHGTGSVAQGHSAGDMARAPWHGGHGAGTRHRLHGAGTRRRGHGAAPRPQLRPLAGALLFSAPSGEGRADIKSPMGASRSSSEAHRPSAFVTGSWRDFKHSHPTSWRFCFWLRPDVTTEQAFSRCFSTFPVGPGRELEERLKFRGHPVFVEPQRLCSGSGRRLWVLGRGEVVFLNQSAPSWLISVPPPPKEKSRGHLMENRVLVLPRFPWEHRGTDEPRPATSSLCHQAPPAQVWGS